MKKNTPHLSDLPSRDDHDPLLRAANLALGATSGMGLGIALGLAASALLPGAGSAPPYGMLAGTAVGAVIGILWRDEPRGG
ncbi:MAG TPA: hypothetical protein VNP72_05735 [Longimicrobium sp.]|nr:hypothetical protein [Longimicrobium sp.]